MNPIAVVLVDYNAQAPPRQGPVAKALNDVRVPVMGEYDGR